MSMRYKGGVLSSTAQITSSSIATGIWTMRQQLQAVGGTKWPSLGPVFPNIGAPYGGGFIGGKINVSGTQYYLIVAPKATGQASKTWGPDVTITGVFSEINGPTNSAYLAGLGASYQAAKFCEDLTIGAYSDWYLPSKNELEVLYYNLKPTTDVNNTSSGANANAVSPEEPINTNYTSGSPAQTSVVSVSGFKTGETEAFATNYWNSTEISGYSGGYAWAQSFVNGAQGGFAKFSTIYVRAVRRIPV